MNDEPKWWDLWPVANSLILIMIAPIISGIRAIRKEDLLRIDRHIAEVQTQLDKLEERVTRHHENHPISGPQR
jgi:hypothetical protein